MKHLNTLAAASSLLVATLAPIHSAQAAEVSSAGQAISICKEKAQIAHPDYKMSKSTKIREKRGVYNITLKVITEAENIKAYCKVTKDGEVSYAKA
ncbi:hypothetical protein [Arenicella xantha]|uniref:Peptidase YpeB-like protein n=1 Tax=Arenicella xantha TaxID=644221 RepID=A0A395JPR5_9GAMM|nr:hypothetical protein [Arenicella xantha]RBP51564.1 hypothetical protein DFR28_102994 [Arenicella xantha]